MSDLDQRFFLQAIDPHYGCVVLEAMFVVGDVGELRALLGPVADGDPELRWDYWLEENDLAAISERYGVAFDGDGREVMLDRWHPLRAVPYVVHTNNELFLLLDGTKKFARIGLEYPPLRHDDEALFDGHVAAGVLHKEVELCPFAKTIRTKDGRSFDGSRYVYYTLKGEEWRIQAWKLLAASFEKTGWNETYERLEGMLFGYEEWQMDWWIAQWRRPPEIVLENIVEDAADIEPHRSGTAGL